MNETFLLKLTFGEQLDVLRIRIDKPAMGVYRWSGWARVGVDQACLSDGRGPLRRAQRAVLRMHMRGNLRLEIRVREPLGVEVRSAIMSPKERV